jgi:hypothetical protein
VVPTKPIPIKTVVVATMSVSVEGVVESDFDNAAKEAFNEITAAGFTGLDQSDVGFRDVQTMIATAPFEAKVTLELTMIMEDFGYENISDFSATVEDTLSVYFVLPSTSTAFINKCVALGSTTITGSSQQQATLRRVVSITFGDVTLEDIAVTVVKTGQPSLSPSKLSNSWSSNPTIGFGQNSNSESAAKSSSAVPVAVGASIGAIAVLCFVVYCMKFRNKSDKKVYSSPSS